MRHSCSRACSRLAGLAQPGLPGQLSLGKSKGLEYFKATYQQVVTQTAQPVTCAAGDVSGGGGALPGNPKTSAVNDSYPSADDTWQVEATSTSGAKDLTAYAICDPDGGLGITSNQCPLGENGSLFATAFCGGSSMPIGGGMSASGPGIRLIRSKPSLPPNSFGWAAATYNPTMDDTLVDTYAICGMNDGVKYRDSKPIKLKHKEEGKATAKCKSDEAVMGGGFEGTKNQTVGLRVLASVSKPWDSKDKGKTPDDGWQIRVLNASGQKVDALASAVCRKP